MKEETYLINLDKIDINKIDSFFKNKNNFFIYFLSKKNQIISSKYNFKFIKNNIDALIFDDKIYCIESGVSYGV